MKINKKLIKELVICLEENNLSELEYTEKDIKIKVARNSFKENNKIEISTNKAELKEEKITTGIEIKSPIILQPGPAALTDGLLQINNCIENWKKQYSY